MTLPARRQRVGALAEPGGTAWTRNPLAEFDDLFNRMGRLLESTVGPGATPAEMPWIPQADISETDDAYVIELDLPGARSEDIDVEINDRELAISGEIKEREREGVMRHRTRRTGRFEFRVVLPGDVRAEDVTAALSDGVLSLTVPKAQPAKARHVEIKKGD
ncbi:Hsp20/alpha crystallin family protein [Streptomyces sp. NPDC096152]|uniref:Hsp20/alpha crystallin family protein n=1 Tax=Streptomyces sp. NPDC096152 TaxID=3366078 RepID=UPI0037FC32FF